MADGTAKREPSKTRYRWLARSCSGAVGWGWMRWGAVGCGGVRWWLARSCPCMFRQPPPNVFSPWRMMYTVDPPALAAAVQRDSQSIGEDGRRAAASAGGVSRLRGRNPNLRGRPHARTYRPRATPPSGVHALTGTCVFSSVHFWFTSRSTPRTHTPPPAPPRPAPCPSGRAARS
eukprot:scaffold12938_cov42-Phaeocystis_antarctica.AAC.1